MRAAREVYIRRVMHGHRPTLRDLVARLRLTPDEARDVHAEECMESLFDRERCGCADLGEREEAEAERRRWPRAAPSDAAAPPSSSTGLLKPDSRLIRRRRNRRSGERADYPA